VFASYEDGMNRSTTFQTTLDGQLPWNAVELHQMSQLLPLYCMLHGWQALPWTQVQCTTFEHWSKKVCATYTSVTFCHLFMYASF